MSMPEKVTPGDGYAAEGEACDDCGDGCLGCGGL